MWALSCALALASAVVGGAVAGIHPFDPGFGAGSVLEIPSATADSVYAGAVLAGGALVAAGDDGDRPSIIRVTAAGALDPMFGGGTGRVAPALGNRASITGICEDSLGRLVIAGLIEDDAGVPRAYVARLRSDGAVDASFGDGGLLIPFGSAPSLAHSVELDGAGRPVAATRFLFPNPAGEGAFVRLTVDGLPDPAFGGGDGIAETAGPLFDATPQPTGIVGFGRLGARSAIVRVTAAGLPDTAFGGGDGVVESSTLAVLTAGTVDASGRALAVGATSTPDQRPALLRLTAAGAVDATFGSGGLAVAPHTGSARAVDVDPDGLIALGGYRSGGGFVTLLTDSGAIDARFGSAGTVTIAGSLGTGETTEVRWTPGGKIAAMGATYLGPSDGPRPQALLALLRLDRTPPTLMLPADQVLEATGPAGASPSLAGLAATDDHDPHPAVACAPATVPLGTHPVTCTATDASGNRSQRSFSVTVVDTTAPTLTLPSALAVDATNPSGAVVTFVATASDSVAGPLPVRCAPASGVTLPVGDTRVSCDATDGRNTVAGSFVVHVRGAQEQFARLRSDTTDPALSRILAGIAQPLAPTRSTCNGLLSYASKADRAGRPDLAVRARRIAAVLGCR